MKATKSTDRMKQALRNLREQIRIERLDVVGLESVRNSVRKERANYPMPIAGYIERVQRDGIDVWCRESILEWIFKLKDEFSFYTSTAMHSLWMVDRFLSRKSVSRQKLLEVALASIRIASKWSEVHPVTMKEAVALSGGRWTPQTLVETEQDLLQELDWMLNAPCVLENSVEIVEHFLKTVSTSNVRSSVVKDQIRISAKMISRFAGTDYNLIGAAPSLVAMASVSKAFELNSSPLHWADIQTMLRDVDADYSVKQLDECLQIISAICIAKNIKIPAADRSTSPTSVDELMLSASGEIEPSIRQKRKPDQTNQAIRKRLRL